MVNFCIAILGGVIVLLGVLFLFSPIPIGLLLISLGLSILVCVSPRARAYLQQVRTRHPSFDRKVHKLEAKVEHRIKVLSEALMQTRPESMNVNRDTNTDKS